MISAPLVGEECVDAALNVILTRLREAQHLPRQESRRGTLLDIAKAMYRERRMRERFLGNLVSFGEPAWDILLDLYVACAEARRVSVSSVCIAAAVPPTTALRWIAILAERRVLTRDEDPTDRRRAWLRLTEEGEQAMTTYLLSLSTR